MPVALSHYEFFTLLYAVWKEKPQHCGVAVTNVISQLRRKIGDGYIETVVNSGYRFAG
ncbi:winged helix-turn-helix domain-containing protein [Lactonifactor longoviformis]|uniref:winged helix-turn-helix domain-containing protein n=1 Tax=Lactonifactor longoviformis TaxID=341220 RepID=UPI0036F23DEC